MASPFFCKSPDGSPRGTGGPSLPDEVAQRFCRDELGITEVLDDKRLAQVPTLTAAAVLLPRTLTTSHLLQLQEDEDEIFEVQQDIRGRSARPDRAAFVPINIEGSPSWIRSIEMFHSIPSQTLMVHHMDNPLLKVSVGSPMSTVCVGGVQRYVACAQLPPAEGDTWKHGPFWLQAGDYSLCVRGGVNQHHASMKLFLDDKPVCVSDVDAAADGEAANVLTQSWSCPDTYFMVEQVVHSVHVATTGPHYLSGETVRHTEAETYAFWMCLSELELKKHEETGVTRVQCSQAQALRQVLP